MGIIKLLSLLFLKEGGGGRVLQQIESSRKENNTFRLRNKWGPSRLAKGRSGYSTNTYKP